MQEFPERGELKRMQREQERERRRIRDRQRRQSMTQEQRERHLARRRRNYQLRRQRAANAQVPYSPFPQLQTLESSAGEASTSDELQGLTSSTFLDYGVLSQGLNQVQETFNFGSKVLEGEFLLCSFTLDNQRENVHTYIIREQLLINLDQPTTQESCSHDHLKNYVHS